MERVSRKELYEQTLKDSSVSWCQLYREEKANREAIEAKYNALVQEIKQQGKKRVVDVHTNFIQGYWK